MELAYHCQHTGWVVIPGFFHGNAPANSNVGSAIAKQVEHIPAGFSHFQILISILEQIANRLPNGFLDGFRNRSGNRMPNQDQDHNPGQDQQPDQDPDAGAGVLLAAVPVETVPAKTPYGDYSPDFLEFWESYPLKKSKGAAWKAWKALGQKRPAFEVLKQAVADAMVSADWVREGGRYIPYPASWLNARGWEDERRPATSVQLTRQGEQNFQAARDWASEKVS